MWRRGAVHECVVFFAGCLWPESHIFDLPYLNDLWRHIFFLFRICVSWHSALSAFHFLCIGVGWTSSHSAGVSGIIPMYGVTMSPSGAGMHPKPVLSDTENTPQLPIRPVGS